MKSADFEASRSLARVVLGPEWNVAEGAAELRAMWARSERDPDIDAVIVIASSAGRGRTSTHAEPHPPEAIGPKTNGLLKPFGIGVRGAVRNEILQLVGEADVIVATPDATFADTSVAEGKPAAHALSLENALLPELEALRLALLGDAAAMSSARALELEVVDAVVSDDELEHELVRRVRWFAPRR